MSDNATLVRRLMILNDHEPNDALPEAAARIAELEAERTAAYVTGWNEAVSEALPKEDVLRARIAELEAALEACSEWQESGDARIAELEAEVARLNGALGELTSAYISGGSDLVAKVRIAELEAELTDAEAEAEKWVALYKKQTTRIAELEAALLATAHDDELEMRIAELEQRLGEATGRIETDAKLITELEAKLRQFEADLEDPTLSVGEAYAWRSEHHGPGKKP